MTTVQMIPPADGSRNIVSVSGRTYSSLPYMSSAVQSFDVSTLSANGWQMLPASTISGGTSEPWYRQFRRLAARARLNNPLENPVLSGTIPWTVSTAFTTGAIVGHGGNVYSCITAGTSAAPGGPAGRGFNITDGTAHWDWIGLQTAPAISASITHNAALSKSYPASAANFIDGSGNVRITGGIPVAEFTPGVAIAAVNQAPLAGNISGNLQAYYGGYTFSFEGTVCEIILRCTADHSFSVIVDGHYVDTMIPFAAGGLALNYISIDFTNVTSLTGGVAAAGRSRHTHNDRDIWH